MTDTVTTKEVADKIGIADGKLGAQGVVFPRYALVWLDTKRPLGMAEISDGGLTAWPPTPTQLSADIPTEAPKDLYPTSDIKFVILKIGELGTKVDRLIDNIKGHGEKIDAVRHRFSFVKGALWVIGGLVGIGIAAATIYVRMQGH